MKKILLALVLPLLAFTSLTYAQESYPINDLPGADQAIVISVDSPSSTKDYTATNCDDLTQDISIALGVASPSPGSPERVGVQFGRINRNGVASSCVSPKAYTGLFNAGNQYGYHTIQFYNNSANPVCITVNVNVDMGGSPCTTNAHGLVYQSADGLDEEPYDPANQSANYLGDIGSSITQPFSVEVNPGYFEILFTNTSNVSLCDVAFNITTDPGDIGAIACSPSTPSSIPISNWSIIIGLFAIVIITVVGFRKRLV